MLSISLKTRIILILCGLAGIIFGLGLMLMVATYRMEEAAAAITPQSLPAAQAAIHTQAIRMRLAALIAMLSTALLCTLLFLVVVYQMLVPLRRLMAEATRHGEPRGSGDDLKALSRRVRVLLHDVDHTSVELERSRETLAHAEKMTVMGKLAASMAHSIRNPFTSVQMRLFSLSRSLELSPTQREDLEVIAAEIRRIDTILQSFLEFSRPPRLRMEPVSPSAVVDSAIRLLEHRLRAYDVNVRVRRSEPLPAVTADPEQLKEVLVNIMVNACEAMVRGGTIDIEERTAPLPDRRRAAVLRVHDSGPGIPPEVCEKIFQPFFSTKEDGTGLGLSIAQRIITDHGGRIDVEAGDGRGTAFIITLALQEPGDEHDSHR
ncbi:MAG: ATP-binding protein [Desulfobacterales bacterium]|jgi:signal transduction histidine kinase|nr:ATP-binding protein [Desulfobacterales bacterium]